jgi:hypothetical protein
LAGVAAGNSSAAPLIDPAAHGIALVEVANGVSLTLRFMDALIEILYLLSNWRLVLCLVASIFIALILSSTFQWFTAGYCITLVLCGTGFGILWQGRSEAGLSLSDPMPPTPISKPVAFLGFAFMGFFWGSVATFLLESPLLAALSLIAAVAAVGVWYRFVLKRPASVSYLAFSAVSLLAGYSPILLLNGHF